MTPCAHRARGRSPRILALVVMLAAFGAAHGSDALAQDGDGDDLVFEEDVAADDSNDTFRTVHVATAALDLPSRWSWSELAPIEMGGMTAELGHATSADQRIHVYVAVIDPFGVDVEFEAVDLLAPLLLDGLATMHDDEVNYRVRRTECMLGGGETEGRLVMYPSDDPPRLLAALGCVMAETTRWGFVVLLVDSNYDRPLLMEIELDEASGVVSSFRFE